MLPTLAPYPLSFSTQWNNWQNLQKAALPAVGRIALALDENAHEEPPALREWTAPCAVPHADGDAHGWHGKHRAWQDNGTLNINSIPVSKVVLDGRPLDSTPGVGLTTCGKFGPMERSTRASAQAARSSFHPKSGLDMVTLRFSFG